MGFLESLGFLGGSCGVAGRSLGFLGASGTIFRIFGEIRGSLSAPSCHHLLMISFSEARFFGSDVGRLWMPFWSSLAVQASKMHPGTQSRFPRHPPGPPGDSKEHQVLTKCSLRINSTTHISCIPAVTIEPQYPEQPLSSNLDGPGQPALQLPFLTKHYAIKGLGVGGSSASL